jgi:hypothetical protein
MAEWISHSSELLHTSLLDIDAFLVPAAVEMFTHVLGYCGERAFSDSLALVDAVSAASRRTSHPRVLVGAPVIDGLRLARCRYSRPRCVARRCATSCSAS